MRSLTAPMNDSNLTMSMFLSFVKAIMCMPSKISAHMMVLSFVAAFTLMAKSNARDTAHDSA
jgi:hypothetical protein